MLNKPCKTLLGKTYSFFLLTRFDFNMCKCRLCRPTSNRFKGLPFKPSRAVSIDLFPHTDHCELMIEFVRINKGTTTEV